MSVCDFEIFFFLFFVLLCFHVNFLLVTLIQSNYTSKNSLYLSHTHTQWDKSPWLAKQNTMDNCSLCRCCRRFSNPFCIISLDIIIIIIIYNRLITRKTIIIRLISSLSSLIMHCVLYFFSHSLSFSFCFKETKTKMSTISLYGCDIYGLIISIIIFHSWSFYFINIMCYSLYNTKKNKPNVNNNNNDGTITIQKNKQKSFRYKLLFLLLKKYLLKYFLLFFPSPIYNISMSTLKYSIHFVR